MLEACLRLQQGVKFVQLADYLTKYNLQREFFVEFYVQDAQSSRKYNIFDLVNQEFEFHELRDR